MDKVDWIQCRYLIVQRGASFNYTPTADAVADETTTNAAGQLTQLVPLDPVHPLSLNTKMVGIPNLLPKLEAMNKRLVDKNEDLNDSDEEVLKEREVTTAETPKLKSKNALGPNASRAQQPTDELSKLKDAFVPVGPELLKLIRILPPPANPNQGAVRTITGEMRAMLKEQERDGPTTCGFYFDPVRAPLSPNARGLRADASRFPQERSNDVRPAQVCSRALMLNPVSDRRTSSPGSSSSPASTPSSRSRSTPPARALVRAKLTIYLRTLLRDMKTHGVTSLLLEVRFPESFSLSPPFFRVIYPRFLPFLHGGGGHVTAGGSLCMVSPSPLRCTHFC